MRRRGASLSCPPSAAAAATAATPTTHGPPISTTATAHRHTFVQAAADVDSTSEEIRAKNNIKQKGDTLPWEVSEEKSIVQDDLMEQVDI